MPLHHPRSSIDRWIALTLICVSIICAPVLLGGISPTMTIAASIPALLGGVCCLIYQLRTKRSVVVSWFLLFPMLGLVTSLFSLVPLPDLIRELFLSGPTERIQWVTSILPQETQQLVRPVLATAPPLTALAVVRLSAGASVLYVISTSLKHQQQRRFLRIFLLAGYFLILSIILSHLVLAETRIYGRYTPSGGPIFYGPMINPNHMARLHGGFALIFAAFAVTAKSRSFKLWYTAGALCAAIAVFATLSRGGILFFGASCVLFVVIWVRHSKEENTPKHRTISQIGKALSIQLILLFAVVSILFLAREQLVQEASTLEDTTLESSKLGLYIPSLRLLQEFWIVGVGPGGFATTYPFVLREEQWAGLTFTHVENILLQTVIDHGLIVGAMFIAIGIVALVTMLHRIRVQRYQLLLPALLFLVSADLLDFFLETTAGLFLAMTVLGILSSHLLHLGRTRRKIPTPLAVGSALALAGIIPWSAYVAYEEGVKKTDNDLVQTPVEQRRVGQERALARYPLDGYAAYRLSHSYRTNNDVKRALQWANRSMTLWPNLNLAHIEAARSLGTMGLIEQALIEYRIAWRTTRTGKSALLKEVSKLTSSVEKRRSIFPEDEVKGQHMLCHLLLREQRYDDAQNCFSYINERVPTRSSLSSSLQLAINRKDSQTGQKAFEQLSKDFGIQGTDAVLRAELVALQQGYPYALDQSKQWFTDLGSPRPLRKWQYQQFKSLGRLPEAFASLQELKNLSSKKSQMRWIDLQEAELHLRQNSLSEALKIILKLQKRFPGDLAILELKLNIELTLKAHQQAQITLDDIKRLRPEHPALVKWTNRIRQLQQTPSQ